MMDNLFGKSSRVKAGTLEKQKSPRPDWDEGQKTPVVPPKLQDTAALPL
jgi:hypothetical protein